MAGVAMGIIVSRIYEAKERLQISFQSVFQDGVRKYEVLRNKGKKGELQSCYISYLRSSVVSHSPLFQLDFYDEQGLLDLVECSVVWDIPFLTDFIYSDIPMEIKPVPHPNDLKPYEIERLWIKEADKYFGCLMVLIKEILSYSILERKIPLQFYYGEYLDIAFQVQEGNK